LILKNNSPTNHPLRGSLLENFVILDLLKTRLNKGLKSNLYCWRDRTGNEIDILIEQSTGAIPVEIKFSETFHVDFLKGINYWQKLNPTIKDSYLIFRGKNVEIEKTKILNGETFYRSKIKG